MSSKSILMAKSKQNLNLKNLSTRSPHSLPGMKNTIWTHHALILFQYNITTPEIHATEIRWNLYYMAIFRSGIDLLATIIIPACLLGYWNYYTHKIIKRRAKILLSAQIMKQTRSERQQPSATDCFSLTFQTIDSLVAGTYI